jgi:hypothetical protein
MEQRRNTRLILDQTVNLTILGDLEIRITAKVKNTSGRGLGLEMARPVGVGCPLKIELEDAVLLGEAMYCRAENGAYYVGIELLQGLSGLGELNQVFRAFTGEPSRLENASAVQPGSGHRQLVH